MLEKDLHLRSVSGQLEMRCDRIENRFSEKEISVQTDFITDHLFPLVILSKSLPTMLVDRIMLKPEINFALQTLL